MQGVLAEDDVTASNLNAAEGAFAGQQVLNAIAVQVTSGRYRGALAVGGQHLEAVAPGKLVRFRDGGGGGPALDHIRSDHEVVFSVLINIAHTG